MKCNIKNKNASINDFSYFCVYSIKYILLINYKGDIITFLHPTWLIASKMLFQHANNLQPPPLHSSTYSPSHCCRFNQCLACKYMNVHIKSIGTYLLYKSHLCLHVVYMVQVVKFCVKSNIYYQFLCNIYTCMT